MVMALRVGRIARSTSFDSSGTFEVGLVIFDVDGTSDLVDSQGPYHRRAQWTRAFTANGSDTVPTARATSSSIRRRRVAARGHGLAPPPTTPTGSTPFVRRPTMGQSLRRHLRHFLAERALPSSPLLPGCPRGPRTRLKAE